MENNMTIENVQGAIDKMVKVELVREDSFPIIRETLTRIGVADRECKNLFQSCHILHKAGNYFITHFKLLIEMDGKKTNVDKIDLSRQNTIAKLLETWGLVKVVGEIAPEDLAPMELIRIVPNGQKKDWNLVAKHRIGRHKQVG